MHRLVSPECCARRLFAWPPSIPGRHPRPSTAFPDQNLRAYGGITAQPRRELSQTPYDRTCAVPSPYLRRTCVASSSGFVGKSEDEATQVRRRYGEGVEEVPPTQGERGCRKNTILTAGVSWHCDTLRTFPPSVANHSLRPLQEALPHRSDAFRAVTLPSP